MDSLINSRPLLQTDSDSDDGHVDEGNDERIISNNTFRSSNLDIPSERNGVVSSSGSSDDLDDDTSHLFAANNIVPNDRFGFNYMVFYLLGTTTLLPWNFFVTAEDYWMYKFRNVTSNSTTASIPNTIFLILNAFYGHRISIKVRMIGSLLLVWVFFLMNTALVKVNTDQWQDQFFDITIVSVVVMNAASAVLSGGLFGISGQFTSEYVTAVVSGQALGGVFTAICEIITLTFVTDPNVSAFIFFTIGNVLLALSVLSYILVSRTEFFKYYTVVKLSTLKTQQQHVSAIGGNTVAEPTFKDILNKVWLYGFSNWLVFAVTLSVYPSVTVLVNSEAHGNGHPWNDIYFIPVTNYLIFNSGDYLGRILAGMIEWPKNSPHIVAVLSILRIGFLPALLFCNTNPRHRMPVYIHSDYIFIILMSVFAFTNGYLANISMIWAPKSVHSSEKEMASSAMAAFLGIGIAFGSTLSLIIVQFL